MSSVALSVIIVCWNGMRYLPPCLAALVPQLPSDAEIVLVDNGSNDGTAAWAREAYPALRVIELPENLGFAGGVNVGLRAARGATLLLLNDDAFVEPGFVAAIEDALARYPSVGAFGAVLLFDHRPDLVASAGVCVRRDGVALDLWVALPAAELPSESQTIFGASGGAAVYRRSLLEDVGLMEAGFFSYLEDVDLAWRARLRGWECLVVPGARARHVYSATGGQGSPLKQRLLGRNRLRTLVRCVPGALLWPNILAILGYDFLAAMYGLLSRQRAIAAGRWAALRELPVLLRERRAILSRCTATTAELARWLEPTETPWGALRTQRRLDALLRERD